MPQKPPQTSPHPCLSRSFPCPLSGCQGRFSRRRDVRRHENSVHRAEKKYCGYIGCRFRGTVRSDVLRKHLRNHHSSSLVTEEYNDVPDVSAERPSVPCSPTQSTSSDAPCPPLKHSNANFVSELYPPNQLSSNRALSKAPLSSNTHESHFYNEPYGVSGVELGNHIFPGIELADEVPLVLRSITSPYNGQADFAYYCHGYHHARLPVLEQGCMFWDRNETLGVYGTGYNVMIDFG